MVGMASWFVKHLRSTGALLDNSYAQTAHGVSGKFFSDGWGDISALDTSKFYRLVRGVQEAPEEFLKVEWHSQKRHNQRKVPYDICEGHLAYIGSTVRKYLPNIPKCCESGKVWLMRPVQGRPGSGAGMQACVVHLAATGEQSRACASNPDAARGHQCKYGLLCSAFCNRMPLVVGQHGQQRRLRACELWQP
jgi:Alpha/beta hydrolase domain containing 18